MNSIEGLWLGAITAFYLVPLLVAYRCCYLLLSRLYGVTLCPYFNFPSINPCSFVCSLCAPIANAKHTHRERNRRRRTRSNLGVSEYREEDSSVHSIRQDGSGGVTATGAIGNASIAPNESGGHSGWRPLLASDSSPIHSQPSNSRISRLPPYFVGDSPTTSHSITQRADATATTAASIIGRQRNHSGRRRRRRSSSTATSIVDSGQRPIKVKRSTKRLTFIAVVFLLPIPLCVITYIWLPRGENGIIYEYVVLVTAVVSWILSQTARDVLSLSRLYGTFKHSAFEYPLSLIYSLFIIFMLPPLSVLVFVIALVLDVFRFRRWVSDDEASTLMIITVAGNVMSTSIFSLLFSTRLFKMNVSQAVMSVPPASIRRDSQLHSAGGPGSRSGRHRRRRRRRLSSIMANNRRRDSITAFHTHHHNYHSYAADKNDSNDNHTHNAVDSETENGHTSASFGFPVLNDSLDSGLSSGNTAGNIPILDSTNQLQTSLASDTSIAESTVVRRTIVDLAVNGSDECNNEGVNDSNNHLRYSSPIRNHQKNGNMDLSETHVDSLLITDHQREDGLVYSTAADTPTSLSPENGDDESTQRDRTPSLRARDVKLKKHQIRITESITKMMVLSIVQLIPAVLHAGILSLCLYTHQFGLFLTFWFYSVSFEVSLTAICLHFNFKVADPAYHRHCHCCHRCCSQLFRDLTVRSIAKRVSQMDRSFEC